VHHCFCDILAVTRGGYLGFVLFCAQIQALGGEIEEALIGGHQEVRVLMLKVGSAAIEAESLGVLW
jgi:hypothetical protein